MRPALQLEGVCVRREGRVLLQVSRLVVAEGERVAIVGPNGAGKSTLLKVAAGLVGADEGRVEVLGSDRARASRAARRALRRDVGLLMQGLHLVPRLSARENVIVGALGRLDGPDAWRSWARLYPKALRDEADAALTDLGLAHRADTRADRLSGGERQKVALARVQLQRARLVLADEPTSALDPAATAQVAEALVRAASLPGRTLVSVLHDVELLPRLATRVIGMAEGRVVWDEAVTALTPGHLRSLYGPAPDGPAAEPPQDPAAAARLACA